MNSRLTIPLEDFPEEGLCLTGELDSAVFGFADSSITPSGPIQYDLEAQLFETELVVRGYLAAPFRMRCDRCLENFDYLLELEDFTCSCDVKGRDLADLTEEVREELVLELPGYPKCEISGRKCAINDTFDDFRLDKDPQSGVNSATPSGKSVWDALDQFPKQ